MVELQNISFSVKDKNLLKKKSKQILSNVSLNIIQGDIVGLVGESGAGKTTLAKIIAGVLQPTSGKLQFNSIEKNEIQILFQNNLELINPFRKVGNILKDVMSISGNRNNVNSYLNKVKLAESILEKHGHQLSGGERQRIALVQLLMVSPKLLILDEPFSAQDSASQEDLVQLFQELNKEQNITILCISHDLNIMSYFPNKLGVMKNGTIIEFGETNDIVKNQKEKYTEFLFKAKEFQLTIDDFSTIM